MKSEIRKPKNDVRQISYKFLMWFNKNKMKIWQISQFSISPFKKIENSESRKRFFLLQFLVVYQTKDSKTKMTSDKQNCNFMT